MNSANQTHGGNITEEARKLRIKESNILDASASIVPFPPPKSIHHCLLKTFSGTSLRKYPDCTYQNFREAIGRWHGIHPSMVLPGNGAAELLTWAARDATEKGTSILIAPGFADYARALNCWNGKYRYIHLPLVWSSKTPQTFPLTTNSNVIWITNPHNPTGQLWSRASLELLLQRHSLVICDEAFLSLVPDGEKQSLVPLVENNSNLIVIRSLTKLFAVAGLRLGYAISKAERLYRWQNWRDPWPLNGLADAVGIMLMNDHKKLQKWTNKVHSWILKEGPWLQSKLSSLPGIRAHPSATNFLLIESENSLLQLRALLRKHHILVRECASFEGLGDNWLRISLQKKKDNKRIILAMKNILN
ncbi:threonine-phosphate decarboxylase [Prochlorococcus sp. MIT 1307]|uniref:pyridoxal phosphate-dependent aminotransferase n=1 Tax=Prochlorococcus sp. MIT 1307 TaxID=3096219 RepID=UPI002A7599D0|nr:threonine-phosphate decarboxylase [Prochlorococcus sp. MIT 1307]